MAVAGIFNKIAAAAASSAPVRHEENSARFNATALQPHSPNARAKGSPASETTVHVGGAGAVAFRPPGRSPSSPGWHPQRALLFLKLHSFPMWFAKLQVFPLGLTTLQRWRLPSGHSPFTQPPLFHLTQKAAPLPVCCWFGCGGSRSARRLPTSCAARLAEPPRDPRAYHRRCP